MPFPTPPSLDRYAATLAGIRRDLDASAAATTPGCLLVVVTAIGGFVALINSFSWDHWYTDPPTLAAIAAYAASLWLVWKAGAWWAGSAPATAAAAEQRLETEVLRPLIASLRPGALYNAGAAAPQRTLERSHLVSYTVFTSANQVRWRAGDLAIEMFGVDCSVSGDSPVDRYFQGLLAWSDIPENDGGMHVVVRSRLLGDARMPGPREAQALDGFPINDHYRVTSNWEPFARALCTPRLQDILRRLAAEGLAVHAAVADRRAWVGLDLPHEDWFRGYPLQARRLLHALDAAHVAELDRQVRVVEEVLTALVEAARAERQAAGR